VHAHLMWLAGVEGGAGVGGVK